MITKKQFCEYIIEREKLHKEETYKDLIPRIYSCTSLGVALEFLGVINKTDYPMEFQYLQSRGGIMYVHYDEATQEVVTLSFREFLSLLPDEIKEENK